MPCCKLCSPHSLVLFGPGQRSPSTERSGAVRNTCHKSAKIAAMSCHCRHRCRRVGRLLHRRQRQAAAWSRMTPGRLRESPAALGGGLLGMLRWIQHSPEEAVAWMGVGGCWRKMMRCGPVHCQCLALEAGPGAVSRDRGRTYNGEGSRESKPQVVFKLARRAKVARFTSEHSRVQ
ncbi:uncharacterized protein B0I36DRAFT_31200 [Microdochium trichocladiopsis]|uniref:Uncharacterized protein n=1 Tax=Microdochium trichocladiopsis TaxID=1682393 RepID=A0A9P8XWA0_9PEZI|nr:uncharacterized protein B0I36DRAFT_31200 [Microdochium trichocladiopsis]KAH7021319.1 hypothetical protein B0I36DRAFT_31200 [Microdochium trichocladiopsis]